MGERVTDASGLRIEIDLRGDAALVQIVGEVDVASAPKLEDALLDAIGRGARRLLIDASGIAFIDSTGLRSVTAALRARDGVHITVQSPTPAVRNVLRVTGLDGIISLE